jgi:hypothetical protein
MHSRIYSSLKSLAVSKATSLVDTNQSNTDALNAQLRHQTSAASLQKLNKQHYKLQPLNKIAAKKRQFEEIGANLRKDELEINSAESRFELVDRLSYKYSSINTKLKTRKREQHINFFDIQYERSITSIFRLKISLLMNQDLLSIVVEKGKNIQEILVEKEIAAETFSKSLFTDPHLMICNKTLCLRQYMTHKQVLKVF